MQEMCNVPTSPDLYGFCLSDLKPYELLELQRSIKIYNENEEDYEKHVMSAATPILNANLSEPLPIAMALMANPRSYSSYSSVEYHAPWMPEEKPSKLQTFFRISITALAFLSFGGYLLCMIVQAIKSKGTTYFYPVLNTSSTLLNNGLKGIRIYRRGR